MKVLVTGGAGFLGSHLVDALVEAGHTVTVFDRVRSKHTADGVAHIEGDLLDARAVEAAVMGNDAVYHLAGFADLNAAKTRPLDTVSANIGGTVTLLEAMRAAGVHRFLFASTVYVYSREGGFYRCSKQACESYIEEYGLRFGLRYTVLRYGSLYGPRADAANGVYRLLRAAIEEGRIAYTGGPDDIREYIHVEDAARLSVDALAPEFEGKHVLLTGPSALRAGDLFTMFEEILGRPVAVDYRKAEGPGSGHYSVTPYAFTPKPGRKLVTTHYVDMGQGLLRMVEEIHHARGGDE
ncbi:MAG TPA: NAD(P)-dependent oxidoreductase [Kofleriaceae bacterium]|nr:NAD(P)-dependent oxidoreductase [Kofleriaceae bacterium]